MNMNINTHIRRTSVMFGSLTLILALTGCWPFGKTPAPNPTKPVTPMITPAPSPIESKSMESMAARASKASAAADAAISATNHLAPSNTATAIKGELEIARNNMDEASADDRNEANARVEKALKGDIAAYRKEADAANARAKDASAALSKLKIEVDAQRKKDAEAWAAITNEWNKKFDEQDKALTKAKNDLEAEKVAISRRVQFWFALGLRLGATALLVLAASRIYGCVTTGIDLLKSIKGASVLLGLSAISFLLSWASGQSWFYWACGGVAATSVLHIGYLAHKERAVTNTLNKVSAAIDSTTIRDSNGNAVSATIDLQSLRGDMNTLEKAIIRTLRIKRDVEDAKASS